jgi:DNA anti-recombination protein RmuC
MREGMVLSRRFWINAASKKENVMAAKGQSLAEKFSRWGVTASNVREHLEEMPHVASDLGEMERMVSEARALESQQEGIRGQAREISNRLQELAKEGEKLRSRLRSHLQAKFGPTSENLRKFGFSPRRTPRRTRVTETPEPEGPAGSPSQP